MMENEFGAMRRLGERQARRASVRSRRSMNECSKHSKTGMAFLLLLLCMAKCLNVAANERVELQKGAAATLLYQIEEDPLGEKDSFLSLPVAEQRKWSVQEDVGLRAKRNRMLNMELTVPVVVKLVGFDDADGKEISATVDEVSRHLKALQLPQPLNVMHGKSHHLAMNAKPFISVVKASQKFAAEVTREIFRTVSKVAAQSVAGTVTVPHAAVDRSIERDSRTDDSTYLVYILNPAKQTLPYTYSYGGNETCKGNTFSNKRYLWMDLSALPPTAGPRFCGAGAILDASFYRPKADDGSILRQEALATISAYISGAMKHLFLPPMLHDSVPLALTTHVWLIHIRSSVADEEEGVDLRGMQEELLSRGPSLLLPNQELVFKSANLFLSHCAFCTAAYFRSMRTAAKGLVEGTPGDIRLARYLDAEELHHLLSEFWPEIKNAAAIPDLFQDPHSKGELSGVVPFRLIPIFLFDVHTTEPVLLDQRHQALAFDDMVVAIRTRAGRIETDFVCNDQIHMVDTTAVTRPILAALLQTGWGLPPSHTAWSRVRNETEEDLQWAFGHLPFGPFSSHLSLSNTLRDMALRNIVLSSLNETITDTLHLLAGIQEYGPEETLLSLRKVRFEFTQRWNVLSYKLEKAVGALSLLNFFSGIYWAQSARKELTALYDISQAAAAGMETKISCFQEALLTWPVVMGLLFGLLLFLLCCTRIDITRNKQKRF